MISLFDENLALEILKSREERGAFQKKVIDKYGHSLISFILNIPGPIKDRPEYRRIHEIGMDAILGELRSLHSHIDYSERIDKNTGSEGYISLDMDPSDLKKIAIGLEEDHLLGRLFDIDVFDKDHNQISRRDLGFSPRKCLICDEDAKVCARAGTHTLEELLDRINKWDQA